jgi:hypothetical protein
MVTEEGEEKADSETILLHVKGEKGNEWARWSFHPTKGRRWVERSDGRESILADHVTRPFSEYEAKMRALSS